MTAEHPGEILRSVLASRGIAQAELGRRMGVKQNRISAVVVGRERISVNFAIGLEEALGEPSAQFWLGTQNLYLLEKAREQRNASG